MAETSTNDKSDSSSFEDLSIPHENEVGDRENMTKTKVDLNTSANDEAKGDEKKEDPNVVDILGNGQLVKTVCIIIKGNKHSENTLERLLYLQLF